MNAPTLIVGLGGRGSEIALRVSKMVNEEQRQRIAFAVFDTDVNELRTIKENNPFVYTIQTSTKLSVGEYLDIDTHARDNWFPVNAILNSKTLTEGAGQVRAVSRLAFDTAVRAGKMEELHKAIESLYQLEGSEYQQALRVIIVSTLAGGTGSGLILPVSLYIKNYLTTRFHQSANITRGFFILPEILYGVIKGETERNNLKSNAYATLREIDAFLMKGDATLPEKYQDSVKVEFPYVGSNEYETYNVRPFDFCFLFDAQNTNGMKLNSFDEYMEHAANCIYAQSIGPMNKRSNSSEDNTIRKLASEKGRNRYAGAGTSILIYPTETVKRYLALNWAKESTSSAWLMFDREYRNLRKQDAEKRKAGVPTPDRDRAGSYINSVDNNANNKVPFAIAIKESCTRSVKNDSGVSSVAYSWDQYIDALDNKISKDSQSSGSDVLESLKTGCLEDIGLIKPSEDREDYDSVYQKFADAYYNLVNYRTEVTKHVQRASSELAFSLFHSDDKDDVSNGAGSDNLSFSLEYYMKNEQGDFIHPCAVRLFLYHVKNSLIKKSVEVKSQLVADTASLEQFVEDAFGDNNADTPDSVYSLQNTKKVSFMDRWKTRLSTDLKNVVTKMYGYVDYVDSEKRNTILLAVLEEGIAHVDGLIKAYEIFFDSLESKISGIQREIDNIEGRYEYQKGQAARYVCASRKCMRSMLEKMGYTGGWNELDPKLCKSIYDRIKSFTALNIKSEDGSYFQNLFNDSIIGFYQDLLMETYTSEVNMDIITAIEREAEYEENIFNDDEVRKYVIDVIKSAKNLAAPFIEKPIGEERDPLYSCTYNPSLMPGDDSPRAALIKSELKDFGGSPDEDIPINQVLFYNSFYGLRANDLSKFAPPQKGVTHDRSAGEYYKAYYELVSKIYPDPTKSLVITPHIDRWWHIVTKMPDLDDDNQEALLNRVYAAFFWGFVENIFSLYQKTDEKYVYRIGNQKILQKNIEGNDKLMVSNGTYCDRFDEVLDAITIYPELIDGILNYVQGELDKELYDGNDKFDNVLIRNCNNFEFPSVADDAGKKTPCSIFDFPFEYRKSVKTESYDDDDALRMANVILAETERILKAFCSNNEFAESLTEFYKDHYERLLVNISKNSKNKKLGSDFLFTSISSLIADKIEEIGMRQEAVALRERTKSFIQDKK